MSYKKLIFSILVLFNLASGNTVLAESLAITNMIFFGDSLSDMGNNTWVLMDNNYAGAPITNQNYQNHPYLWLNYLAEAKLGKPVYPSSTSGLNPLYDNISYAYASAETGNEYLNTNWPQSSTNQYVNTSNCLQTGGGVIKNQAGVTISTCTPGLLKQVDTYLNNVRHKPNSGSLFFIWSGANDLQNFIYSYVTNNSQKPSDSELRAVVKRVTDNINEAKSKLIDAGVKPNMIYILNLPDLSKVPALETSNPSWVFWIKEHMLEVPTTASYTSLDFNRELQSQKGEEKYRLPSSHYIDVAQFFNDMIIHPQNYNLNNTDESCVLKNAIPTCTGFLFYNDKHPTTWVHKIFSDIVLAILNQQQI